MNGNFKKYLVGILVLITVGWIAWVSSSVIVGKSERAEARTERSHTAQSIEEIKQGIKSLTEYFMLPKPK